MTSKISGSLILCKKNGKKDTGYCLLAGNSYKLGSKSDCDIRFAVDKFKSYFCTISIDNQGKVNIKKQSSCPVKVNDKEVKSSNILKCGDVIKIGNRAFQWDTNVKKGVQIKVVKSKAVRSSLGSRRRRSLNDFKAKSNRLQNTSTVRRLSTWKEIDENIVSFKDVLKSSNFFISTSPVKLSTPEAEENTSSRAETSGATCKISRNVKKTPVVGSNKKETQEKEKGARPSRIPRKYFGTLSHNMRKKPRSKSFTVETQKKLSLKSPNIRSVSTFELGKISFTQTPKTLNLDSPDAEKLQSVSAFDLRKMADEISVNTFEEFKENVKTPVSKSKRRTLTRNSSTPKVLSLSESVNLPEPEAPVVTPDSVAHKPVTPNIKLLKSIRKKNDSIKKSFDKMALMKKRKISTGVDELMNPAKRFKRTEESPLGSIGSSILVNSSSMLENTFNSFNSGSKISNSFNVSSPKRSIINSEKASEVNTSLHSFIHDMSGISGIKSLHETNSFENKSKYLRTDHKSTVNSTPNENITPKSFYNDSFSIIPEGEHKTPGKSVKKSRQSNLVAKSASLELIDFRSLENSTSGKSDLELLERSIKTLSRRKTLVKTNDETDAIQPEESAKKSSIRDVKILQTSDMSLNRTEISVELSQRKKSVKLDLSDVILVKTPDISLNRTTRKSVKVVNDESEADQLEDAFKTSVQRRRSLKADLSNARLMKTPHHSLNLSQKSVQIDNESGVIQLEKSGQRSSQRKKSLKANSSGTKLMKTPDHSLNRGQKSIKDTNESNAYQLEESTDSFNRRRRTIKLNLSGVNTPVISRNRTRKSVGDEKSDTNLMKGSVKTPGRKKSLKTETTPNVSLNLSQKSVKELNESDAYILEESLTSKSRRKWSLKTDVQLKKSQDTSLNLTEKSLKTSQLDLSGVKLGKKLGHKQKSPKNDLTNIKGLKRLLKTPNHVQKSPRNDLTNVKGLRNLLKTPGREQKSPKNDLTNITGLKELLKTPNRKQKSPENDLTDLKGLKKLLKTPGRTRKSIKNDLTDVTGVRRLMSPIKSPKNDLTDVEGVKELMKTPEPTQNSSKKELSDAENAERLMNLQNCSEKDFQDSRDSARFLSAFNLQNSPRNYKVEVQKMTTPFGTPELEDKSPKSSSTDFRNFKKSLSSSKIQKITKNSSKQNNVDTENLLSPLTVQKSPRHNVTSRRGLKTGNQKLLRPSKPQNSPKNDLTDVRGVKTLLKTPGGKQKSPKNDLTDVRGVKNLFSPLKAQNLPRNDLTDLRGVKNLLSPLKSQKSPKNDLTDVRGVRRIMRTPKNDSPKNELVDFRGVNRLMNPPQGQKSPRNDLSNVEGVKDLLQTPGGKQRTPKNDLRDVQGVKALMKTPGRIQKPPRDDLTDVEGLEMLFNTPVIMKKVIKDEQKIEKSIEAKYYSPDNLDLLFDKLKQEDPKNIDGSSDSFKEIPVRNPLRTYERKIKSMSPEKSKMHVLNRRRSLNVESSKTTLNVQKWVEEQKEYVNKKKIKGNDSDTRNLTVSKIIKVDERISGENVAKRKRRGRNANLDINVPVITVSRTRRRGKENVAHSTPVTGQEDHSEKDQSQKLEEIQIHEKQDEEKNLKGRINRGRASPQRNKEKTTGTNEENENVPSMEMSKETPKLITDEKQSELSEGRKKRKRLESSPSPANLPRRRGRQGKCQLTPATNQKDDIEIIVDLTSEHEKKEIDGQLLEENITESRRQRRRLINNETASSSPITRSRRRAKENLTPVPNLENEAEKETPVTRGRTRRIKKIDQGTEEAERKEPNAVLKENQLNQKEMIVSSRSRRGRRANEKDENQSIVEQKDEQIQKVDEERQEAEEKSVSMPRTRRGRRAVQDKIVEEKDSEEPKDVESEKPRTLRGRRVNNKDKNVEKNTEASKNRESKIETDVQQTQMPEIENEVNRKQLRTRRVRIEENKEQLNNEEETKKTPKIKNEIETRQTRLRRGKTANDEGEELKKKGKEVENLEEITKQLSTRRGRRGKKQEEENSQERNDETTENLQNENEATTKQTRMRRGRRGDIVKDQEEEENSEHKNVIETQNRRRRGRKAAENEPEQEKNTPKEMLIDDEKEKDTKKIESRSRKLEPETETPEIQTRTRRVKKDVEEVKSEGKRTAKRKISSEETAEEQVVKRTRAQKVKESEENSLVSTRTTRRNKK